MSVVAGSPASSGPFRQGIGLFALATAAFVYVTAETLPIGLLPQLATGLHVREGAIGLLVTVYAGVAGLTAVPMTAWTNRVPRRQVVVWSVTLLAVSQLLIAVAPDYGVVLGARVVCAFAHGVFWSVLAPVAARLVAPGRGGHATAVVFAGNSLAFVVGTPGATALGDLLGWRAATGVVAAAAALSVVALRHALPPLPSEAPPGDARDRLAAIPAAFRSRPLVAVCAVTALVVLGQFTAYTYISALLRRDGGLGGIALSLVLGAYGVAGLAGLALCGWVIDRRPRLVGASCAATLSVALGGLYLVGPGSTGFTIASVVLWGGAFTAIPVCLQAAVLRVAPQSTDTASALYVVAFQFGIGGGALSGSLLVDTGHLGGLPLIAAVFSTGATVAVLAARRAFPSRSSLLVQRGVTT